MDYELKPHIHGQWKVIFNDKIDITCKDSSEKPEYLVRPKTVFIGSLEQCETFIKCQH